MAHQDESILEARQKMEQHEQTRHSEEVIEEENTHSIYEEELHIFQIPVRFAEHAILDGKAMLRMPADFTTRSEEEVKQVFFLGNPPKYVYNNQYLDFTVALNYTDHFVTEEQIPEFVKQVKIVLSRIAPGNHLLSEQNLHRSEGNMVILTMLANALDGVNHSTMFFASVEGKMFIGTIAFSQEYSRRLSSIADEIARSLRILKKEE